MDSKPKAWGTTLGILGMGWRLAIPYKIQILILCGLLKNCKFAVFDNQYLRIVHRISDLVKRELA